jgi:hypothetical protein
LDVSIEVGNKRISWTLIQCGRSSGEISQANLYQSVPDFEHGNSVLHVYARSNYAEEIKKLIDGCENQAFYAMSLKTNCFGETPAILAAKRGHKEALLALLQPMILCHDVKQLDTFLHHKNKEGHQLLTYVSHHAMTLSVIHGILIEMETLVHNHDSYAIKECIRSTLGSSMSSRFTTELLQRLRHKQSPVGRAATFIRILMITFVIRTLFLLLDMYTDVMLLLDYWKQWSQESLDDASSNVVYFPGVVEPPKNPCKETSVVEANGTIRASHVWATVNTTLGCYPGHIGGRDRFCTTISILLLPFFLYYFELLRFRVFSRWVEKMFKNAALCLTTS